MIQLKVETRDADRALRALSVLEPAVARETKRAISDIGKELAAAVTAASPDSPPVSGWRATPSGWPAWSKVTGKSRRVGAGVIVSMSDSSGGIIAQMAEFVGNKTAIKTTLGEHLADMFNSSRPGFGPTASNSRRQAKGRVGTRVLNERYPAVVEQIREACDKAVAEVNRRMP